MRHALLQQRCLTHGAREAAARCPACTHFFCRECITEHDDKIICGNCLRLATQGLKTTKKNLSLFALPVQVITGLALLWFLFFSFGEVLLKIPASWVDGSAWADRSSD